MSYVARILSEQGFFKVFLSEKEGICIQKESTGQVHTNADKGVLKSLAEILDVAEDEIKVETLYLYNDESCVFGQFLSAEHRDQFLECEWSDYACDRRPVLAILKTQPPPVFTRPDRSWRS